jgi:hypothetical protein
MDKSYPWVGLGLIDDLKCACRMLGGDPDKRYRTCATRSPTGRRASDTRKTGV